MWSGSVRGQRRGCKGTPRFHWGMCLPSPQAAPSFWIQALASCGPSPAPGTCASGFKFGWSHRWRRASPALLPGHSSGGGLGHMVVAGKFTPLRLFRLFCTSHACFELATLCTWCFSLPVAAATPPRGGLPPPLVIPCRRCESSSFHRHYQLLA